MIVPIAWKQWILLVIYCGHNGRSDLSADVAGSALPLWCQYINCAESIGSNHCFQAIVTPGLQGGNR